LFKRSSLGIDLALLISELEQKQSTLIYERSHILLGAISSRDYSNKLVRSLGDLLHPETPFTQHQLSDLFELTKDAIARLLRLGFSQRSVMEIPTRLFSKATEVEGQALTMFPKHYLRTEGGVGDRRIWIPMSPAERAALDALTQQQRIAVLADYMHADPTIYKCIFSVDGLSGGTSETIGGIVLYSPATESRLPSGPQEPELFGQDPAVNPVNAYVEIAALDVEQAQEKGSAAVEAALDAINLATPPPPTPTIRPGRWIFIDPNSPAYFGFTEPPAPSPSNLHYTTKSTSAIAARFAGLQAPPELGSGSIPEHGLVHEITTSLRWLRRAEESTRPEDRLLFNWVAFEKLFVRHRNENDDSHSVYETIIDLYPLIDMYAYALQLADWPAIYADSMWSGAMARGHTLRLPAELIQLIYRIDDPVSAAGFLENLRPTLGLVENQRFREHLNEYIAWIDDPKAAHAILESLLNRTRSL
jgi:hypothetical protein